MLYRPAQGSVPLIYDPMKCVQLCWGAITFDLQTIRKNAIRSRKGAEAAKGGGGGKGGRGGEGKEADSAHTFKYWM